jgi:hypothetical protein
MPWGEFSPLAVPPWRSSPPTPAEEPVAGAGRPSSSHVFRADRPQKRQTADPPSHATAPRSHGVDGGAEGALRPAALLGAVCQANCLRAQQLGDGPEGGTSPTCTNCGHENSTRPTYRRLVSKAPDKQDRLHDIVGDLSRRPTVGREPRSWSKVAGSRLALTYGVWDRRAEVGRGRHTAL